MKENLISPNNRKKNGFVIIFCLFISFFGSSCAISRTDEIQLPATSRSQMLKFTLSLDKNTYRIGEPIQASLKLTNIGSDPIIVNRRLILNVSFAPPETRDCYLFIMGPHGQLIDFNSSVQVAQLKSNDFVILGSNAMIQRTYANLLDFYDIAEPGKYSIQAVYVNQMDPDSRKAWKGTLRSNIVYFLIEP
jgi:hypothetical protein